MEEHNQHTMEHNLVTVRPVAQQSQHVKQRKPFIEANTLEVSFEEVSNNHIIPVFVKDNEPLISHSEFIETTRELTWEVFNQEQILLPEIRVSHPVKGRIPEAKDKPAQLLEEWEKTLYYERMAFIIEIPSITEQVGGNSLSLTIGGVKAYHQDNLYSRTVSDQHFKVFIGFRNTVCTNLCVSTDGYLRQASVKNIDQLRSLIRSLLQAYQPVEDLKNMSSLCNYSLTEAQFAQLVGRCRMYNYLPSDLKADIQPLLFGDQMINTVVKDFYRDNSFCRDQTGNINLWKLYNLFTGANKSSYIDSFLDRSVNASTLVQHLRHSIQHREHNWYLN